VYPHNGFYPRALQRYVEGFDLHCVKLYTIQFPNKLRKAASLGEPLRGELMLRQLPLLRHVGKTVIALFEAVCFLRILIITAPYRIVTILGGLERIRDKIS
jgi:hypothetical protein